MEHLCWKDHISAVASKISKSIGIISKSRYYLSQKLLFMLYYSLIYPYLYYGNIIWGSTYHTNLYRLRILQKRIVRIITNSNYDAHTLPLLHQYSILRLDDIHSLQLGLFMYSIENSLYANTFLNMFFKNSQFHSYPTRHSTNFRPKLCRTNIKKFTLTSQGPNLWNSLPNDIKTTPTFSSFKIKLKKHMTSLLLSEMYL